MNWKIDFGNPVYSDHPSYRNVRKEFYPNAKIINMSNNFNADFIEGERVENADAETSDQFAARHVEKVWEKLKALHINANIKPMFGDLSGASIKYFLETGTINGAFYQALSELMDIGRTFGGNKEEVKRLQANVDSLKQMFEVSQKENEQLREWKRQMLLVMPPMQEIANAIGLIAGETIHDKILPGIERLILERDIAQGRNRELLEALKWYADTGNYCANFPSGELVLRPTYNKQESLGMKATNALNNQPLNPNSSKKD